MPNLYDLILQYIRNLFPEGYADFFVLAFAAMLAPILLAEAPALFRVLHRAGQWHWREALTLLPLLAGLANLALVRVLWRLMLIVNQFSLAERRACRFFHPCDFFPTLAVQEAEGELERLIIPSLLWLLAAYVLTLRGLVVLAAGRRQRRNRTETVAV